MPPGSPLLAISDVESHRRRLSDVVNRGRFNTLSEKSRPTAYASSALPRELHLSGSWRGFLPAFALAWFALEEACPSWRDPSRPCVDPSEAALARAGGVAVPARPHATLQTPGHPRGCCRRPML